MSTDPRDNPGSTLLTFAAILVLGCGACGGGGGSPSVKPSSTTVGSPMSSFCASQRSCPGISQAMFQVCGSCDPTTRYFRQAMCSLDQKLRVAIDSCVKGRSGIAIRGKDIFGGIVSGCVKQRLRNEPEMVTAFTSIAQKHKASESEQVAWRTSCDSLWAEHQRSKTAGATTPDSP